MIDRSKPLPIHEFPSLIDEVARLKEHVAKVPELTRDAQYLLYPDGDEAVKCHSDLGGSEDWLTDVDLAKTLCELLDDAPKLLDVLSMTRAGDADAISEILSLLEEIADISKGDRELLTRYRDMAAAMEGTK
jgi:hypothetical protein